MPRRLDPHHLPAKYRDEEPHTRHVTKLALRIFDAIRRDFDLTPLDRELLHAAARLHDIGYAQKPLEHVQESVRLILENGVRGSSREETRLVAGVVLLHRKNLGKSLHDPLVAASPDKKRLLRLAAILRVADGLDHGHIQDLRIRAIRARPREVLMVAVSPGYDGNVAWAESKADLWRRAFGRPLRFRIEKSGEKSGAYQGVTGKRDTLLTAMRRILYLLFRSITENQERISISGSEEPVHDMRVAARRFRAGLWMLGKNLGGTAAARVESDIGDFLERLGPARDADVRLRLLGKPPGKPARIRRRRSLDERDVVKRAATLKLEAYQRLGNRLRSPDHGEMLGRIAWLLRVEWPGLREGCRDEDYARFAESQLRRASRRVEEHARLVNWDDSESLHNLRRVVRRARYTAEFFTPALPRKAGRLALRYKRLADILGDIHDLDLLLALCPAPSRLARRLHLRRARLAKSLLEARS